LIGRNWISLGEWNLAFRRHAEDGEVAPRRDIVRGGNAVVAVPAITALRLTSAHDEPNIRQNVSPPEPLAALISRCYSSKIGFF
jgi:hypothetical protein